MRRVRSGFGARVSSRRQLHWLFRQLVYPVQQSEAEAQWPMESLQHTPAWQCPMQHWLSAVQLEPAGRHVADWQTRPALHVRLEQQSLVAVHMYVTARQVAWHVVAADAKLLVLPQ